MSKKNQTDFEKAKENVEVALVDLTGSAKDKVSTVTDAAGERISDATDAVKEVADAAKDETENVVRGVKDSDSFEEVKEAVGSSRLDDVFGGKKDSKPSLSGRVKTVDMVWVVAGFVVSVLVLRHRKSA